MRRSVGKTRLRYNLCEQNAGHYIHGNSNCWKQLKTVASHLKLLWLFPRTWAACTACNIYTNPIYIQNLSRHGDGINNCHWNCSGSRRDSPPIVFASFLERCAVRQGQSFSAETLKRGKNILYVNAGKIETIIGKKIGPPKLTST